LEEDLIGMREMGDIFDVTDSLGIHREQITVPLTKIDPGGVRKLPTGELEIVVPRTAPLEQWLEKLRAELHRLGFRPVDGE